jgi:ETFB lysine methyltransferase
MTNSSSADSAAAVSPSVSPSTSASPSAAVSATVTVAAVASQLSLQLSASLPSLSSARPLKPEVRVRYHTLEVGEHDIHLRTLRDRQQYYDHNDEAEKLGISAASWPLFGVVWDSSIVLAQYLLTLDIANKRILEVGCGIGLCSLLLNKRHADITATDQHPEAAAFLAENVKLNHDQPIPFVRTDWAEQSAELGMFDLIVGSDLLYEPDHVALLADFIEQHAKPTCLIILVDPGRGFHGRFSKRLVSLGYVHSTQKSTTANGLAVEFRGQILSYQRAPAAI